LAVRLEWEGKPTRVERFALPFQTVERINESRATRERDSGGLFGSGRLSSRVSQLIWGDNKLVMSSLLSEFAGAVDLVYIDPPFDTGTDFSFSVKIGGGSVAKAPSILEETAYRDTWGRGRESYLTMLYERLVLIHDLLSATGTLFLHVGRNIAQPVKLLCDEIFGADRFINDITWKRSHAHGDAGQGAKHFGRVTESILIYRKGDTATWHPQYLAYTDEIVKRDYKFFDEASGRQYRLAPVDGPGGAAKGNPHYEFLGVTGYWRYSQETMQALHDAGEIVLSSTGRSLSRRRFLDEAKGTPVTDLWDDVNRISPTSSERVAYATQKPEALLERIIKVASDPGDLVADFFVGSGTTAAVAEKLDRRWLACDLGRFAISTTRKRLLSIADCRPFEIKNLGSYERKRWQVATGNGALRAYLDTILTFYRAEPVEGFATLHGRKAGRMVHVGATDAPVTLDETEEVMDEMADNGIDGCDLLGWEWEMGLHDTITETARRRGLDLRPRQIPREVMERQVIDSDVVRFFELAHVDLDVRRQGREARVVLRDFLIPSEELISPKVREQISDWSDLIDYWSVDFDFTDEVFDNQWQAYRTREQPTLATETDWHEYERPGRYAIVVKLIDIFGNDTTKLAEVGIK
jgi:adenine-specific DNA-methyltransferase